MRVLVVYDSVYGNTEKIAEAIGRGIGGDAKVVRVSKSALADAGPVDMLVVGSPTLGGRPSQPVQDFLAGIPETTVKGMKVAAFDTRYSGKFVKMFGFAAEKIAESMVSKGAKLAAPPEGFVVTGKKGPIREGEHERAALWAKEIAK